LVEKPEPPSHPPKSDVERGGWANDVIINSKIKWNGYKAKTRDPIKESTVTKRPVVERPVVENIVKIPKINVELIKPNDPRYLTLNEKQQRSR
jgi:hypothetical protein